MKKNFTMKSKITLFYQISLEAIRAVRFFYLSTESMPVQTEKMKKRQREREMLLMKEEESEHISIERPLSLVTKNPYLPKVVYFHSILQMRN